MSDNFESIDEYYETLHQNEESTDYEFDNESDDNKQKKPIKHSRNKNVNKKSKNETQVEIIELSDDDNSEDTSCSEEKTNLKDSQLDDEHEYKFSSQNSAISPIISSEDEEMEPPKKKRKSNDDDEIILPKIKKPKEKIEDDDLKNFIVDEEEEDEEDIKKHLFIPSKSDSEESFDDDFSEDISEFSESDEEEDDSPDFQTIESPKSKSQSKSQSKLQQKSKLPLKKKKRRQISEEKELAKEREYFEGKLNKRKKQQDITSFLKRKESEKFENELEKRKEKNIIEIENDSLEDEFPKWKRIVNLSKKDDEEPILLPIKLAELLKPHQLQGIQFIWEHIVDPPSDDLRGCILAHSMGLGKTLQIIASTLMMIQEGICKKILIVCPKSVITNWGKEYKEWCKKGGMKCPSLYTLDDTVKQWEERLVLMKRWNRIGGVLFISFNLFSRMVGDFKNKKHVKNLRIYEQCKELVIDPDVVIVDEGHKIKNAKSSLYKAMMQIKTRKRIITTGTPLQNNLEEYYYMQNFVRPGYWDPKEFKTFFVIPIKEGQRMDSTEIEIRLMKRRSYILTKEMKKWVHRRDQSVLKLDLPEKYEHVLYIKINKFQKKLYRDFLTANKGQKHNLLYLSAILQKIINHPDLIRQYCIKNGIREPQEPKCREIVDLSDDEPIIEITDLDDLPPVGEDVKIDFSWANPVLSKDYKLLDVTKSSKMSILFSIIEKCIAIHEKVLVFSQFTQTLDIIENIFCKNDRIKLRKNIDYCRLDGSINSIQRQQMINNFNKKGSNLKVFLISTKAGGLGVNLTAASRVVLYDVCWNPADDQQSIFRTFRYGQDKHVHIYRLVAAGTIEEAIWKRCISKTWLFKRIVDEKTPARVLKNEDFEFFKFETAQQEIKKLKVDEKILSNFELLNQVCKDAKGDVVQIVEHESLFIDVDSERISKEEKEFSEREYRERKTLLNGLPQIPADEIENTKSTFGNSFGGGSCLGNSLGNSFGSNFGQFTWKLPSANEINKFNAKPSNRGITKNSITWNIQPTQSMNTQSMQRTIQQIIQRSLQQPINRQQPIQQQSIQQPNRQQSIQQPVPVNNSLENPIDLTDE